MGAWAAWMWSSRKCLMRSCQHEPESQRNLSSVMWDQRLKELKMRCYPECFLTKRSVGESCIIMSVQVMYCMWCMNAGYWGELDVDGVIEGQLALELRQLSVVPTLSRLNHIVYVEHPRLSAVGQNHHSQVWQPGRAKTGSLFYIQKNINNTLKQKCVHTWSFLLCLLMSGQSLGRSPSASHRTSGF